jgi:hypothetical protein
MAKVGLAFIVTPGAIRIIVALRVHAFSRTQALRLPDIIKKL